MSFAAKLSKKYLVSNKHHTIFTLISICVAVAFITLLFTLFSTIRGINLNIAKYENPYHAYVYGLNQEQTKTLEKCEMIDKTEYFKSSDLKIFSDGDEYEDTERSNDYVTGVIFNKNIDFADEELEKAIKEIGIECVNGEGDTDSEQGADFEINNYLLDLELIGTQAKADFAQIFAVVCVGIMLIAIFGRFIIDTAFEISSKEREKQFGILESIGASPKQTRRIIRWEGVFLSIIGIPIGLVIGILLAYIIYKMGWGTFCDIMTKNSEPDLINDFKDIVNIYISPLYIISSVIVSFVWVLFSAYGTGMRITKMTAIQAITRSSKNVKKVKKNPFFGRIFGWIGKLSARNIRREKKRFIITILTMTLSITLFSSFTYIVNGINSINEQKKEEFDSMSDFSIAPVISDDDFFLSRKDAEKYYDLLNTDCFSSRSLSVDEYARDFKNIKFLMHGEQSKDEYGNVYSVDDSVSLAPISEEFYNNYFEKYTGVPYSELDKKNSVIAVTNCSGGKVADVKKGQEIEIEFRNFLGYDDEDDKRITETKQVKLNVAGISEEPVNFNDVDQQEHYQTSPGELCLLCSEKEYFNILGDDWNYVGVFFKANKADGYSYHDVEKYLSDNKMQILYTEYYNILEFETKMAVVTIIGRVLIGIIAAIAAINLINIISTGIINRRWEIAALQSVGMSKKQTHKLLILECFQYTAISGFLSVILLFGIEFLTIILSSDFLYFSDEEIMGAFLNMKIFIYALIAMAVSFVVGLIATLIPLRKIDKTSITDSIKEP